MVFSKYIVGENRYGGIVFRFRHFQVGSLSGLYSIHLSGIVWRFFGGICVGRGVVSYSRAR